MVLPFSQSQVVPVFQPIAGYPKKLCLFNHVQLDPQFVLITMDCWTHDIPAFPFLDLLLTGGHISQHAAVRLRPSRKPPYYLCNFNRRTCDLPMSDLDKRAFLCALQNGSTGHLPIAYSLGSTPICVDTGASASISSNKDDFIKLHYTKNLNLQGIATGLPIASIGTLNWTISTDSDSHVVLEIQNALFVPQCPMNLLSPQQLAQQTQCPGDGFNALAHIGLLHFAGHQRTVLLEPSSNLPIFHTVGLSPQALASTTTAMADTRSISVFNAKLDNLTEIQRQLLRVHYPLGHLGFNSIQAIARLGFLPKQLASCPKPLCSSCEFGKAHQKATPTPGAPLDSDHLQPGDCVSVDQLESNTPGLVPQTKGALTKSTLQAATLFCDHASRFLHLTCHSSTGALDAISAKCAFEREASLANVNIKKYRADNGIFNSSAWKSTCDALQQQTLLWHQRSPPKWDSRAPNPNHC
jgi:hypothetical protein